MKKNYLFTFSVLLTWLFGFTALAAQTNQTKVQLSPNELTKTTKSAVDDDSKKEHNLLNNKLWSIDEKRIPLINEKKNTNPSLRSAAGYETILHGSVLYADNWSTNKYGVYSFTTKTPVTFTPVFLNDNLRSYSGVYVDGKYYVFTGTYFEGYYTFYYKICDTKTWQIKNIAVEYFEDIAIDMTYDPVTENVYGISYSYATKKYEILSTYNMETGTSTPVGSIPELVAIAANKQGELYGIAPDGNLYLIDKVDCSTILIGNTEVITSEMQSATFDYATGKLFWSPNFSDKTSYLYEVNTATAEVTLISQHPNNQQVLGLYTIEPETSLSAPDAATDLKVNFTAPSATTGKISFKVPSKTYGGENLTGTLTGEIKITGQEAIALTNLTPGQNYESSTITFDEGTQVITVAISNTIGKGYDAILSIWVGEDYPVAVSALTLEKNQDGKPLIKWNAPTTGLHNGHLNTASLKYKVIREPNSVIVAENLTATSFTDNTIGQDLVMHTYTVIPSSVAGEGPAATSEKITFNDSFSIPYSEDFQTELDRDLWTIVDKNGQATWGFDQDNKGMTYHRTAQTTLPADDWMISPALKLQAGYTYKFEYNAFTHKIIRVYPESFKVTLGTSVDTETHTVLLNDHKGIENISPETFSMEHTIPADGKYHVGFYVYSGEDGYKLTIKDLKVTLVSAALAPGEVTDLDIEKGPSGALFATLSFKAPVLNHLGETLSEISRISIYKGNDETPVYSFISPAPGEALTWKDTDPVNGMNTYRITGFNEYGNGREISRTLHIGQDAPVAVKDLVLTDLEGEAYITWTAPTEGKDKGYLDIASLKYKIVRNPDLVVVADNYTGTTYTDGSMEGGIGNYSYTIIPSSTGGEGEAVTSNTAAIGKGLAVPFEEKFPNQAAFNMWKVIDNNAGNTWSYYSSPKSARYPYTSKPGDDWLFSPGLYLTAGSTYEITYDFKNQMSSDTHKMKVSIGTTDTPESHTATLNDHSNIKGTSVQPNTVTFSAPATGRYHLGFYLYSDGGNYAFFLTGVKVTLLSEAGVPGPVTDLSVVADAQGALSADISFKVPSTTLSGADLDNVTAVDIYRNEEAVPVKSYPNPALGESLSFKDAPSSSGLYTYRIIASNESGNSIEAKSTAYIGQDVPAAVTDLVLVDDDGKAFISWIAPVKGLHEGYLAANSITYKILRNPDSKVVANNLTTTRFTDTDFGSKPELYSYSVIPVSPGGEGKIAVTKNMMFGTPYPVPFMESFAGLAFQKAPWAVDKEEKSDAEWAITAKGKLPDANPQDNDGGLVSFNSFYSGSGQSARLISPTIDISAFENPVLRFYMYHIQSFTRNDHVITEISVNGSEFEETGTFRVTQGNGWTFYEVPLIKYVGKKRINLGFRGISDNGSNMHLDNISIADSYKHELIANSFNGPSKMEVNSTATFEVEIKNKGAYKTSAYTVDFFKNGEVLETKTGIEVPAGESKIISFEVSSILDDAGIMYTYQAVINYTEDEVPANNKTRFIQTRIVIPKFPSIETLAGAAAGEDIQLNWTEPTKDNYYSERLTESFEEYKSFIIKNIGEWTMLDLDGGQTTYVTDFPAYDNKGSAMAFQTFNPSSLGVSVSGWSAHTGDQMLACFSSFTPPNNDWLISPILTGEAQTVKFYAHSLNDKYGLERIVVHYSTTDKEISSFKKLSTGTYLQVPTTWQEYTFNLPEGTRYFAIQCVSDDAFLLLIDDITFTKGEEPVELQLEGYNVYRNGAKIITKGAGEKSHLDTELEKGVYKYKVTAVYDKGESIYSNEVTVNTINVGIDDNEILVKVYSLSGHIIIEGAANQPVSVTTIDGRVLYNLIGKEKERIAVPNGVYAVKVGKEVVKIMVQ